jgi:hypothetical protein
LVTKDPEDWHPVPPEPPLTRADLSALEERIVERVAMACEVASPMGGGQATRALVAALRKAGAK